MKLITLGICPLKVDTGIVVRTQVEQQAEIVQGFDRSEASRPALVYCHMVVSIRCSLIGAVVGTVYWGHAILSGTRIATEKPSIEAQTKRRAAGAEYRGVSCRLNR